MLSRIYHLIKKISLFFFFGKLCIRTEHFGPFVEDFGDRKEWEYSGFSTRCSDDISTVTTEDSRHDIIFMT